MKTSKYIIGSITLLTVFLTSSCKKLVEVDAPNNTLVTATVFANDATAITAQLSVYARMENTNYSIAKTTGLSADEFNTYSTSQNELDFYRNALSAQIDGGAGGNWPLFYNYIFQENSIIENVKKSTGMSAKVQQYMTGEALFMRAWCYFQLVNQFGGVPLITSTDYTVNGSLPRATTDQIYSQIISDLQTSLGSLSSTYLNATDDGTTIDRVRPTTWAADALLARVYLYVGKYKEAEDAANLVIGNTSLFSLPSDLSKVFFKNSSEAIWQLTPPTGQLYTYDGDATILTATPLTFILSSQLLNAFETNDSRKLNWTKSFSSNGNTWYFSYKYKDNRQATSLNEYTMVLRLAEQYLIRAEARAQQGKLQGANSAESDLNAIRNRANLPNTTANTLSSMLTAIYHERQVELFNENDRWYDLKRTKTVDAVMSVVTPQKLGVWNSYQQLYPIAPSDLQYDPNLSQNPGY